MRNKEPLDKDRMYMYYICVYKLAYVFIYREREGERGRERDFM